MGVLESLCFFKMRADVKDSLIVKSLAYENGCVQRFQPELKCRMLPVCKDIKSSISLFSTFQSENMSSIYLFHCSGFVLFKLIISVSTADIKMFAKETARVVHRF